MSGSRSPASFWHAPCRADDDSSIYLAFSGNAENICSIIQVVFNPLVRQKISFLIYCYDLKKLFVQVQPKEYFLFLLGFFDTCNRDFVAAAACVPDLCSTAALFLRIICFSVFPVFFTLFARGVLKPVGLCFALFKFRCLLCTYGYG